MLIVLSRGLYSNVSASEMGLTEDEWLVRSDMIRRFHELTHVICRRLYPDDIQPVRDELIADAVGLYAAYGHFETEKEMRFLGIRNGHYEGGRLETYTDVRPDPFADGAKTDGVKAKNISGKGDSASAHDHFCQPGIPAVCL